jgi:hypothetical protein
MPGLVPGINVLALQRSKTRMAGPRLPKGIFGADDLAALRPAGGTSPAMTRSD